MIGRVLGNYKILEKIGEGGMGEVFRGLDQMLEREVAIKSLRPELASREDIIKRFRSEAVALAKLNHPNIATLYTFFQEGGEFFMVMEFVRGELLSNRLAQHGPISWQTASEIVLQALDGLQHAHSHGIVHRDIKPSNIMLEASGTVKLMDFGIARILGQSRLTRTGHLIGTLEYMSPEQIQGKETDARSDLYSLGIVFFETLTGHVPFESSSDYDLIKSQVEDPPPSPSTISRGIPPEIEAIVLRALAKNPKKRFQSTEPMRAELQVLLDRAPAAADSLAATLKAHLSHVQEAARPSNREPEQDPALGDTPVPRFRWKDYPGVIAALVTLIGITLGMVFFSRTSNIVSPPEIDQPLTSLQDRQEKTSAIRETHLPPPAVGLESELEPELTIAPLPAPSGEPSDTLEILLNNGDEALAALRLTNPKKNSAFYFYRQALQLDPDDVRAKQGMEKIVSKYIALAETARRRGKHSQVKTYLNRASAIAPNSPRIAAAQKRLASPPKKTSLRSQRRSTSPSKPRSSAAAKKPGSRATRTAKKRYYPNIRAANAGYRNGEISKQEYAQIKRRLATRLQSEIANLKQMYRAGRITKRQYNERVRSAKLRYKG